MIYTLTRDDIPSLSAWIKNTRSRERVFLAPPAGLEPATVEIRSREAVVTVVVVDDDAMIPAVIAEDFHLCFDGYAHTVLIIIIAQPAVASCDCFALLSFVHVFLQFWLEQSDWIENIIPQAGVVVNPIA